jgi:hypothetical protein
VQNDQEAIDDKDALKLKKEKAQAGIYQYSVRYGADRPARYQLFFV